MALPKFEVSTYDIKLPISQLDIKYRPILSKRGEESYDCQ